MLYPSCKPFRMKGGEVERVKGIVARFTRVVVSGGIKWSH